MSGLNVLCPELYSRLESLFGRVKVANHLEEVGRSVEQDFSAAFSPSGTTQTSSRRKVQIDRGGEYYCVCCPICNESRFRLWINHRFQEFPFAVICFNSKCFQVRANRESLYDLIFSSFGKKRATVFRGERMSDDSMAEFKHPGRVVGLSALPIDHPARLYVQSRLFNPDELDANYDVGYCIEAFREFYPVTDRIVFPVIFQGSAVGWQARAIRDNFSGGKYYGMPGSWKRFVFYNFDRAVKQKWAVVVEGATSVWRIGDNVMSSLGKTFSSYHYGLLSTYMPGKPIGIYFDSDDPEASECADDIIDVIRRSRTNPVFKVVGPEGSDPAVLSREVNLSIIEESAKAAGIRLES